MKTLILSASDLNKDGRLQSLVSIFRIITNVEIITKYNGHGFYLHEDVKWCNLSLKSFFKSFKFFYSYFQNSSTNDLILLDNRRAALFGIFLYPILKKRTIIYDMREFYLLKTGETILNRLGTIFEYLLIKRADIVICANKYRSRLVKVNYGLKKKPLIIENNRRLMSGSITQESEKIINSYLKIIKLKSKPKQLTNFVLTDGFSLQRRSIEIINECAKFKDEIHLFIFGKNKEEAEKYIKNKGYTNVSHMGMVEGNILSEILLYMDVGFVVYGDHDLNNKYCASGKLYEFMHMGIPVVTSYNIPLRKVIRTEKIGISDQNIYKSIRKMLQEIYYYKKNCIKSSKKLNTTDFEKLCADQILGELKREYK